jgi:hypothetical protein
VEGINLEADSGKNRLATFSRISALVMNYTFPLESKYLAPGGMSTCNTPWSTSRDACCVPSMGSPSIWREKGVLESMDALLKGMQRAWSELR